METPPTTQQEDASTPTARATALTRTQLVQHRHSPKLRLVFSATLGDRLSGRRSHRQLTSLTPRWRRAWLKLRAPPPLLLPSLAAPRRKRHPFQPAEFPLTLARLILTRSIHSRGQLRPQAPRPTPALTSSTRTRPASLRRPLPTGRPLHLRAIQLELRLGPERVNCTYSLSPTGSRREQA